ncbi:MAG: hypothetical protein NZM00_11215 [Anaerolinea sp.]|nr:hypothetical protein [Anaerolinea sp.]
MTISTTVAHRSFGPDLRRDLRTVGWLRWRQFRDDAVYWLRVLGYQPHEKAFSQQLYVLYLALFGLIWVVAMFGYLAESARLIARQIGPEGAAGAVEILSWLILGGLIYVLAAALQSTPLKLTFPDMAYLAASPVNRAAPTLFNFLRLVSVRVIVLIVPALLGGIFISEGQGRSFTLTDGLRVTLALILFVLITWGAAWTFGLIRLIVPGARRIRFLWLLPWALILPAYLLPEVSRLPGWMFTQVVVDQLPAPGYVLLAAAAAAFLALVIRLGRSVSLILAADESLLYARLQALGTLVWTQPRLQARIRLQTGSAGRRALLKLPEAEGVRMLLARAAISYIRHPTALIGVAVWGLALTAAAIFVIERALPVQAWVGWMLFAGLVVPRGMLRVFEDDVQEPFLRQFLPFDGLQLLLADALIPWLIALVGGAVGVVLMQPASPVLIYAGIALPLAAIVLFLINAWSLTQRRTLQMRLFGTLIAFGGAAGAGAVLQTPVAGLIVLGLAALILSGMVLQDG